MPHSHRRFPQEFRDEAVRLAETSGRTRREVAEDLGIGLSTLRHWLDRRGEHEIDHLPQDRQEDVTAELQRLRRENVCGFECAVDVFSGELIDLWEHDSLPPSRRCGVILTMR